MIFNVDGHGCMQLQRNAVTIWAVTDQLIWMSRDFSLMQFFKKIVRETLFWARIVSLLLLATQNCWQYHVNHAMC